MNRKYNSLIFLFILLFPLLFINIAPVIATEEENIDSFDVHPANRWDELSNTGWNVAIDDGTLNSTDTGDGTTDIVKQERELRDLDGKIEIRFKLIISADSTSFSDEFRIYLSGAGNGADKFMYLHVTKIQKDAFTTTNVKIDDTDNVQQSFGLSGDERVYDDTWYILKIDYNILKSTSRWRLSFDNGSKVFDYDYSDFREDIGDFRANLFTSTELFLMIVSSSNTNGVTSNHLIDYVKASFKERQWAQFDTPTDAGWLEDAPLLAYVEDNTDDTSAWRLTVPRLDSVSGTMTTQWSDATDTNFVDGDSIEMSLNIYGVDFDDGDLHKVGGIFFRMIVDTGTHQSQNWIRIDDETGTPIIFLGEQAGSPWEIKPTVTFVFSIQEDRSRMDIRARASFNARDPEDFFDVVGSIDISDASADITNEFIIEMSYLAHFDGDVEATMTFTDFAFVDRDIFIDIINAVVDPISSFLTVIFTAAFRFLAGIFRIVGDIITAAISIGVGLIETAVGLVVGAVEAVGVILADILTAVGELAADIATAVWDGIGDALDFITDAIADIATDIWISFSSVAGDIIDALLTALAIVADEAAAVIFAVLEFLIVLVLDIVDGVIDFLITMTFFFWDLLGLPDLIAIYDTVIVGSIQVAVAIPELVIWLLDVWFFWAGGVVFIGLLILLGFPVVASKNPGELVYNFMHVNGFDATLGAGIIGFKIKVPIGFLFWPVFFLMFLTPLLL